MNKKYTLLLMAHGNPDHGEDPTKMVAPFLKVECETIEGCQEMTRSYIEVYDLGSGNFTGGHVFWDGEETGFIAYNGRYIESKKTIYDEDGSLVDALELLKKAREWQYGEEFPWC